MIKINSIKSVKTDWNANDGIYNDLDDDIYNDYDSYIIAPQNESRQAVTLKISSRKKKNISKTYNKSVELLNKVKGSVDMINIKSDNKKSINVNDRINKINNVSKQSNKKEANQEQINSFIEKYKDYKNEFGKISAYDYICKSCSSQLSSFLDNHYSPNKDILLNLVKEKILEIQGEARSLGIPSSIYDYLSDEQIHETLTIINKKRTIGAAVNYLYSATLYGSGLDVKMSRGRKRKSIY